MSDTTRDRRTGKVCTTQHGNVIVWRGHLCEGANLTTTGDNFCLWTRCGKHDVPADAAAESDIINVDCGECRKIWEDETGYEPSEARQGLIPIPKGYAEQ